MLWIVLLLNRHEKSQIRIIIKHRPIYLMISIEFVQLETLSFYHLLYHPVVTRYHFQTKTMWWRGEIVWLRVQYSSENSSELVKLLPTVTLMNVFDGTCFNIKLYKSKQGKFFQELMVNDNFYCLLVGVISQMRCAFLGFHLSKTIKIFQGIWGILKVPIC